MSKKMAHCLLSDEAPGHQAWLGSGEKSLRKEERLIGLTRSAFPFKEMQQKIS
jgi:hypothetical protein